MSVILWELQPASRAEEQKGEGNADQCTDDNLQQFQHDQLGVEVMALRATDTACTP
jgi:hypothetical protein